MHGQRSSSARRGERSNCRHPLKQWAGQGVIGLVAGCRAATTAGGINGGARSRRWLRPATRPRAAHAPRWGSRRERAAISTSATSPSEIGSWWCSLTDRGRGGRNSRRCRRQGALVGAVLRPCCGAAVARTLSSRTPPGRGLSGATRPGTVVHLPFTWPDPPRDSRFEPPEPPPIAQLLKRQPWQLRRLLSGDIPSHHVA